MELSFEDVMGIWASVTDFPDGWQDHIEEVLYRISEMKGSDEYASAREKIEELQSDTLSLRNDIVDTLNGALDGTISKEDVEALFREYGEELSEVEQRLIEVELEPEENDDDKYFFLGDDEEDENY